MQRALLTELYDLTDGDYIERLHPNLDLGDNVALGMANHSFFGIFQSSRHVVIQKLSYRLNKLGVSLGSNLNPEQLALDLENVASKHLRPLLDKFEYLYWPTAEKRTFLNWLSKKKILAIDNVMFWRAAFLQVLLDIGWDEKKNKFFTGATNNNLPKIKRVVESLSSLAGYLDGYCLPNPFGDMPDYSSPVGEFPLRIFKSLYNTLVDLSEEEDTHASEEFNFIIDWLVRQRRFTHLPEFKINNKSERDLFEERNITRSTMAILPNKFIPGEYKNTAMRLLEKHERLNHRVACAILAFLQHENVKNKVSTLKALFQHLNLDHFDPSISYDATIYLSFGEEVESYFASRSAECMPKKSLYELLGENRYRFNLKDQMDKLDALISDFPTLSLLHKDVMLCHLIIRGNTFTVCEEKFKRYLQSAADLNEDLSNNVVIMLKDLFNKTLEEVIPQLVKFGYANQAFWDKAIKGEITQERGRSNDVFRFFGISHLDLGRFALPNRKRKRLDDNRELEFENTVDKKARTEPK